MSNNSLANIDAFQASQYSKKCTIYNLYSSHCNWSHTFTKIRGQYHSHQLVAINYDLFHHGMLQCHQYELENFFNMWELDDQYDYKSTILQARAVIIKHTMHGRFDSVESYMNYLVSEHQRKSSTNDSVYRAILIHKALSIFLTQSELQLIEAVDESMALKVRYVVRSIEELLFDYHMEDGMDAVVRECNLRYLPTPNQLHHGDVLAFSATDYMFIIKVNQGCWKHCVQQYISNFKPSVYINGSNIPYSFRELHPKSPIPDGRGYECMGLLGRSNGLKYVNPLLSSMPYDYFKLDNCSVVGDVLTDWDDNTLSLIAIEPFHLRLILPNLNYNQNNAICADIRRYLANPVFVKADVNTEQAAKFPDDFVLLLPEQDSSLCHWQPTSDCYSDPFDNPAHCTFLHIYNYQKNCQIVLFQSLLLFLVEDLIRLIFEY